MDVHLLWSLAQTGYGFMAIAAATASWCIWHRSARVRDTTFLCVSLAALAVHYVLLAADAFLRVQLPTRPLTVPGAYGHVALVVSGAFLVWFLLAWLTRWYTPSDDDRWQVPAIRVLIGCAAVVSVWMGVRLTWAVATGASAPTAQWNAGFPMSMAGMILSFCFPGALGLLARTFTQLPTRNPRWTTRWLNGGRPPWPATLVSANVQSIEASRATRLIMFVYVWISSLVVFPWVHGWSEGALIVIRTFLLPGLIASVYYQARFLFFDVLLKVGIAWTLLALLVTTALFTVGAYTVPAETQMYVPLVSVVTVAALALFGGLMKRLNSWLDRLLFRRPDYERVLSAMIEGMARCSSQQRLAEFVTAELRDALSAAFVRYDTRTTETDDLVVAIGSPKRPRGTLTFGPRLRQQPYGSDDLLFIYAVVAQFAAQLEAFDAQQSAQLATNAELKALRAQINPHFLFNALNTLAEMTRGHAAAERATLNLARVFRYALDSTRHERVPLHEEVAAVRAYLEIEQERFEELLRFEIDVPDALSQIRVPPMLLQPLVENAVKHGLSSKVQGGTVRIAAARENGHLRLSVQDDGVGFDPDRTSRSIGLTTVGTRVERTGGSCRVQSIPGAGTLVTLAVALQ